MHERVTYNHLFALLCCSRVIKTLCCTSGITIPWILFDCSFVVLPFILIHVCISVCMASGVRSGSFAKVCICLSICLFVWLSTCFSFEQEHRLSVDFAGSVGSGRGRKKTSGWLLCGYYAPTHSAVCGEKRSGSVGSGRGIKKTSGSLLCGYNTSSQSVVCGENVLWT